MALFTDEDMQAFADLGEELALKDDCDILRKSNGYPDASGGHKPTWPTVETVKCAVLDHSSLESVPVAGQVAPRLAKKILLPRGTDVRDNDRLQVNGVLYTITNIPDPTSYEVFRRVHVQVAALQGALS